MLTRLLSSAFGAFLLSLSGLTISTPTSIEPALANSPASSPANSPANSPADSPADSPDHPNKGATSSAPPREHNASDRSLAAQQDSDRIRHTLPIESINARLEVNAQSETLRTLQIHDSDKEKDAFGLSLRHVVSRTPASEFSLSLGFSYLDESLLPPPAASRQPPSTNLLAPAASEASARLGPPRENSSGGPPQPPHTQSPNNRPSDPQADSLPPSRSSRPLPPSPSDAGVIQTGIVHFSQNYRQRDQSGQWLVRSQFNLGTELASSPAHMNTDTQFFSWTSRIERTQRLNENNQLTLQLDTQLSPNNLLPPHQFKTKDRQFNDFERAGRPSQIAGNSGIRLRLEDRIALLQSRSHATHRGRSTEPIVALIPFVDLGYTWGQSNPAIRDQRFFGRAGLGLSMQPIPGLNVQIDYLTYWGDLPANGNEQDLYMTLEYQERW